MWANESVFYQIYPLGFCGAPFENDGKNVSRIRKVLDWIPHLKNLGINAVYFSPVFESDTHGYNTRDYRKIDTRLGNNQDFKEVCDALHEEGIKVILDGVFNHVGRGFFAFQDVLEKKWDSSYKDWFYLDFQGNSPYQDGFYYEGWEGNYDLVKINLSHPDVIRYLTDSIQGWIQEFGIDGLRLDVAYMVDRNFLSLLRRESEKWKPDFFLQGEMIGGDYKQILNPQMCHSVTNYECYKGIYSSFNSYNLFEIAHSLQRQFGKDPWCLYRDMHLVSFLDNHDVSRISSILNKESHLPLAYALLFAMPGIPCIYYGSEWGVPGDKSQGDPTLRPCFEQPVWNDLCDYIQKLTHVKTSHPALNYGGIEMLQLTNRQLIFEREVESERFIFALNIDENDFTANFNARAGKGYDFISEQEVDFGGGLFIPKETALLIKTER